MLFILFVWNDTFLALYDTLLMFLARYDKLLARYDTLFIQYESRLLPIRVLGVVVCSRVCSLTEIKDITNAGYLLFLQLHCEALKKTFYCLKKKIFVKYVMCIICTILTNRKHCNCILKCFTFSGDTMTQQLHERKFANAKW